MRCALPLLAFLFALPLLAPGTARAQTGATGIGTCMGAAGSVPSVYWSISVQDPNNAAAYNGLATTAAATLLSQAECYCNSKDLYLEGKVLTPLTSTSIAFDVWAGSSCTTAANRAAGSTQCAQVSPQVDVKLFGMSVSTIPEQRIPVRLLFDASGLSCPATSAVKSMFFLFGSDFSANYCQIDLPSRGLVPSAPTGLTAGSGDTAINLSWTAPLIGNGNVLPTQYQILCADHLGRPLSVANGNSTDDHGAYAHQESAAGLKHALSYSTCVSGKTIQRRVIATGGSLGSTGDGGTTAITFDAGLVADPPTSAQGGTPLGTQDEPLLTTEDTGVDGGAVPSGGTPGVGLFTNLDKKFVCSDVVDGTNTSARIKGLVNGETYSFVVVGIDEFGNPSPSNVSTGVPQPVEDLYRRFLDEGGKSQGFCFIATAAFGSYQHPYVQILRHFRDEALLPYAAGRSFVGWYYATSPPYAEYIKAHDRARWAVRQGLWPVIAFAWLWLHVGGFQLLLFFVGVFAFGTRRRWWPRTHAAASSDGAEAPEASPVEPAAPSAADAQAASVGSRV